MRREQWSGGLWLVVVLAGCSERITGDDLGAQAETQAQTGTEAESGETTGEDPMLTPEDLAEIDAVQAELELIVAGTLAYFAELQPVEDTPHLCPYPEGSPGGGHAGATPALAFNCNEGPAGKCVPIDEAGAGHYTTDLWTFNSVWNKVGWMREFGVGHEFHYDLEIINVLDSYGGCTFKAIAQADFDDDGVFSHYSISGSVDELGEVVGELVVVDPYE